MYNYMYACSTRGIDAKVVSEECLHHKILLNIDLTKFLIYHFSYLSFLFFSYLWEREGPLFSSFEQKL